MKDREPIRMADREIELEKPPRGQEGERIRFVTSGIEEVANAMLRFSVYPTPDAALMIREAIHQADFENKVAQALSRAVIVDPNLANPDLKSEQGLVDGAALTIAKAKIVEPDLDKREKRLLNRVTKRVLKDISKVLVSRKEKAVAGSIGVALVAAACAGGGEGMARAEQLYTETPASKPIATSAVSPDFLSSPEAQEKEVLEMFMFDSQDGSLWKISKADLNIVGNSLGLFQGWVDKESVPWADAEPDANIRYGRWANREGMGIVKFEKVEGAELNPEAAIIDLTDGSAWRMIEEDAEIVGNLSADFDGWVPEESIQEDERGETIRWGLWSNREGRGRVRFERIESTQSQ